MQNTLTVDSELEPKSGWHKLARPALLFVVLAGLWLAGRATGLTELATPERIQQLMLGAGFCGMLVYMVAFSVGVMVFVPGLLFVFASVWTWGMLVGGLIALVSATLAVVVGFLFSRFVGGSALKEIKNPRIRKMLDKLSDRPVRTVALLRLFLFISPPLNSALALSSVRFRDYAVGSALGLVIPMTFVVLFIDRIKDWTM